MSSIESDVRQFIIDNLLFGETDKPLSGDDSFLEQGIIDSTGVLELVTFLEGKYGIQIEEQELVPANLDSLNKVVSFIGRKTETSA